MKKYYFNMSKYAHNIELAKNVAFNNEDWKAYNQIVNVLSELVNNQVGALSLVDYNTWKQATEISAGACEYRSRCNRG